MSDALVNSTPRRADASDAMDGSTVPASEMLRVVSIGGAALKAHITPCSSPILPAPYSAKPHVSRKANLTEQVVCATRRPVGPAAVNAGEGNRRRLAMELTGRMTPDER